MFNIMLGSPLGSTLAHMLFQHKKELGVKHVTEVTVFRTEDTEEAALPYPVVELVYRVVDVPEPDEEVRDIQRHGGVQVRSIGRREAANGMLHVYEYRVSRDGRVQLS
jgi:hypothetical protein